MPLNRFKEALYVHKMDCPVHMPDGLKTCRLESLRNSIFHSIPLTFRSFSNFDVFHVNLFSYFTSPAS